MHPEVARTFKEALVRSLPVIREQIPNCFDTYLIWTRNTSTDNSQGWSGRQTTLPNWDRVNLASIGKLCDIAKDFTQAFTQYQPEYSQNFSVGRMTMLFSHGSCADVVMSAIRLLYDRHNSLELEDGEIAAIVAEFGEFIDAATIKIHYSAQLLNFSMEAEEIDLSNGVFVKQLTEKEVSAIHCRFHRDKYSDGIHDCALVCICDEPKRFGDQATTLARKNRAVSDKFDKALIALRTFKPGHVGYEKIRGNSVRFCPYDVSEYGHRDLFVPLGTYRISMTEAKTLEQHAAAIFSIREPAMTMACSRLADAETRLRPEDRLVDAVIGLEALLLPGLNSELKFRFAIHYSTFGDSPEERREYFQVAKGLYDARSTIAHGGHLNANGFLIGHVKLQVLEAAERACDVLRSVIRHFLTDPSCTPYKSLGYWERKFFGLKEASDETVQRHSTG